MGIRGSVSRSTLADANEMRDWRIHADFAQVLIAIARRLYAEDDFGLDLEETVYALDSTTIDLCLSVLPWAPFQRSKAAVKLHTLLDLRGNIPSFIHVSDGRWHDARVLDEIIPQAGAFYVMDRGYIHFKRLRRLNLSAAFFVIRAHKKFRFQRLYSRPVDKSSGLRCDQTVVATGTHTATDYPEKLRRIKYRDPESGKTADLPDQQLRPAGADHRRPLQMPVAGRTVLQMDQAAPQDQALLRHLRERRQDANLDRGIRLRPDRHHQKTPRSAGQSLHNPADPERHRLPENPASSVA